ncbi:MULTISPECIES: calcium-binding protein [Microvirga]|uniref:Calcium-binding protein n=2 Tax=Microvirga TaxID=186650 RepID=A0ABW9Z4D4_9HYPH|nr:calcium-binding protein [Microvirga arsenatis]NBJ13080.1 calcium-binding protein [Microvirga arsenatis]NBJ26801.1 calcium-binding protein [Microvirga arsenatis]
MAKKSAQHNDHASESSHSRGATVKTFGDVNLYIGKGHRDLYSGTDLQDLVFGRGGPDTLRGGGMDDDLLGGKGNDVLRGGAGMDHLDGGRGDDRVIGGLEADALRGGDGDDYLNEGVGHGDLEGGRGDDTLVGGPGGDAFVISPDSGHDVIKDFDAGPGILDHLAIRDIEPEDLRFEDTERGVLISWNDGEGSVLLEGVKKTELAQDDFMFADDRKVIQPTSADAERVTAVEFIKNEGEALTPPALGADERPDAWFRFDDFNIEFGGAGSDTLLGTSKRDYFVGLGGDDQLSGKGGDDDLRGGAGNDTLVGGDGMDHLKGEDGNDHLFGGAMADSLMGEAGDDALAAGAGHDMLDGGMGDDTLDGGDGADAFIVAPDSGNDVVVGGFDAGPGAFDHIALRDITPDQVTVQDTSRGGQAGVLVSWNTDADAAAEGSIFLVGLSKNQMAQDDFMFDAADAREGGFISDDAITYDGSQLIFQDETVASAGYYML